MAEKRNKHRNAIDFYKKQRAAIKEDVATANEGTVDEEPAAISQNLVPSSNDDIAAAFKTVVQPKAVTNAKVFVRRKDQSQRNTKDEENFIGYQAKDHYTEAGYSMLSGFEADASKHVLDLTGDDDSTMRKKNNVMRWDVKKKKYVKADQTDGKNKKIKTESGVWIPASYKSDRYAKWRERSKLV
jgi:ATP-dependent RNA helicase DDX54/DBP10